MDPWYWRRWRWRMMQYPPWWWYPYDLPPFWEPPEIGPEDEIRFLEEMECRLMDELERVRKRLKELKGEEGIKRNSGSEEHEDEG